MLSARAMVLGSLVKEMSYSKALYFSGQAYGFTYFPLFLDPPGAWDDENNRWLASLYGLSYERVMAEESNYIANIRKYLQQGLPVLACRAWFGVSEAGGKMTAGGKRVSWWEGMSKQARTRVHYLSIVGMDRARGLLYVNDPIYCWWGRKAKYVSFDMDRFTRLAGKPRHMHQYIIKVFKKTGKPRKAEHEIQELVSQRIIKKLKGDATAYDTPDMWRSFFDIRKTPKVKHGLEGLKAFKDDLKPHRFKKILEFVNRKRGQRPVGRLTYLNLFIYHRSMLTSIAAEYLEANNRIEEWKWLLELHMLYEKLWTSTTEICSIFRSSQGLGQAVDSSRPTLQEMRETISEMIGHMQSYLKNHS